MINLYYTKKTGRAIKEKITFFYFVAKFQRPLSLGGGRGRGGKALMSQPLREELFFAASLKDL